MTDILKDSYERVWMILLRRDPFESDDELRALFSDVRLVAWRDCLPETKSRAERVMALIDILAERTNSTGENALALFLHVLAENIAPDTDYHRQLVELTEEIGAAVNATSTKSPNTHPVYNISINGDVQGSAIGNDATVVMVKKTAAYAIARIVGQPSTDPRLQIHQGYILVVGISVDVPPGYRNAALYLPEDKDRFDFQIAVYVKDMDVAPNWIQPYTFIRDKKSPLIEFTLIPTVPGTNHIRVEYYYERHWLAKIEFEVEVVEAEELEPASSFQ